MTAVCIFRPRGARCGCLRCSPPPPLGSTTGERIPSRVVHARGAGAHGVFESYGNQSALTRAGFLGGAGRKTDVFVRFSTVVHPAGSPETLRDPRGFAVKFKIPTAYGGGVWDLVGLSLDVFFIRDQVTFPDLAHALQPGTFVTGGGGRCTIRGWAGWRPRRLSSAAGVDWWVFVRGGLG